MCIPTLDVGDPQCNLKTNRLNINKTSNNFDLITLLPLALDQGSSLWAYVQYHQKLEIPQSQLDQDSGQVTTSSGVLRSPSVLPLNYVINTSLYCVSPPSSASIFLASPLPISQNHMISSKNQTSSTQPIPKCRSKYIYNSSLSHQTTKTFLIGGGTQPIASNCNTLQKPPSPQLLPQQQLYNPYKLITLNPISPIAPWRPATTLMVVESLRTPMGFLEQATLDLIKHYCQRPPDSVVASTTTNTSLQLRTSDIQQLIGHGSPPNSNIFYLIPRDPLSYY
jgi:hypothetical protein